MSRHPESTGIKDGCIRKSVLTEYFQHEFQHELRDRR